MLLIVLRKKRFMSANYHNVYINYQSSIHSFCWYALSSYHIYLSTGNRNIVANRRVCIPDGLMRTTFYLTDEQAKIKKKKKFKILIRHNKRSQGISVTKEQHLKGILLNINTTLLINILQYKTFLNKYFKIYVIRDKYKTK